MTLHGHSRSEARSLALHRAALERLRKDPAVQAAVLRLLDRWLDEEAHLSSRPWLEEWRTMLTSWTFDDMEERILDVERGQVLRQCSPLAPALTPQERWSILRRVNETFDQRSKGETA